MSGSSSTVDLVWLIQKRLKCSRHAVMCMVAHGQVYIDGHCIQHRWLRHWTEDQLYGRVLKCPAGEFRIIGSRLLKDFEQMRLA